MGPWVVWKKNKVFAILPAMSSNPFMSENKQEIGTRQGQSPHLQPPQPNTPGTLHMTVTKSLSAEGPSREEPREFFKGLKLMSLNTFAFREFSYCLQKQSLSCNFNSLYFFFPPLLFPFNNIWIHFSNTFLITRKREIVFFKAGIISQWREQRICCSFIYMGELH